MFSLFDLPDRQNYEAPSSLTSCHNSLCRLIPPSFSEHVKKHTLLFLSMDTPLLLSWKQGGAQKTFHMHARNPENRFCSRVEAPTVWMGQFPQYSRKQWITSPQTHRLFLTRKVLSQRSWVWRHCQPNFHCRQKTWTTRPPHFKKTFLLSDIQVSTSAGTIM